jgi:uncharacterized delta-60 repeat protein
MRRAARAAALLLLFVIPACGGGGGGGGGAVPPPVFNRAWAFDERVFAVAPAVDGSGDVFAAGFFTIAGSVSSKGVARLHADGGVDAAFAVAGKLGGLSYAVAPALDGSGDVYLGGAFTGFDGNASANFVRLNRDGTYDAGFDLGTGFNNSVYVALPLNDGSGDVIVGGDFTSYDGTPALGVIKLNSDGSIDAGFAVGAASQTVVRAIALANDGTGDVYVGGLFVGYGTSTLDNVVRLNSDGSIDAGFVVANGGFNATVYEICPAPDGSGDVYFGGDLTVNHMATTQYRIIRLNADGSVDTGFLPGLGFPSTVRSIVPASDGSGDLFVGGDFYSYRSSPVLRLIRLNSDASVDASFAFGTGFPLNCSVHAIAPGPGGSVYVGGDFYAYRSTGTDGLLRVLSSGDADPTFRTGAGANDDVYCLSEVGDGSGDLWAGGFFDFYDGASSKGLVRVNHDGTRDPSLSIGTGFTNYVEAVAPAGDGSGDVYCGGGFYAFNGAFPNNILRLNADGTPEAAFVVGGGFSSNVYALAAAPDGSGDVYVGGIFGLHSGVTVNGIVRLNANGSRDAGFATGTGVSGGASGGVRVIFPLPSSQVYIGGDFTSYDGDAAVRLMRVGSDGVLDATFATGAGFNGMVKAILAAPDGSGDVYVAGDFTTYQGAPAVRVIRISSLGAPVASFVPGIGFNFVVNALASAGDGTGDVYVGGQFTQYQGTTARRIARLRPDGTPATSFSSGTGFNGEVRALVTGPLGRVYVGGTFTTYKTAVADRLTRP